MNYTSLKLRQLIVAFIVVTLIQTQPALADDRTFVAPTFPETTLNLHDSIVSAAWDDIITFSNVPEYGVGGYIKFAHNTTHFFSLFVVNITNWIAIEFGSDGVDCMLPGHDAWVFYINQDNTIRAVDAKYNGITAPVVDSQNDLLTEAIFTKNLVYIEVIRKFNTGDTSGSDIEFANGTSMYLTVASDRNHDSDRTPYFLDIQFTDIGNIQEVEAPKIVDWTSRKEFILYGAMIMVVLFITTHYIIRVRVSPLAHGSRFIDSTIMKPPKFKERWNTLLDREPKKKNKEKSKGTPGGNE